MTRRNVPELANLKVQQVVVNMDTLEDELAPHAKGVDIALAAFGVGKGSAKMPDQETRKSEITYPAAFASAAKAGSARVLAMMTAAGADSQSSTKYLRNIGDKEKKTKELKFDFLGLYRPAMILGNSNTPSALGFVGVVSFLDQKPSTLAGIEGHRQLSTRARTTPLEKGLDHEIRRRT